MNITHPSAMTNPAKALSTERTLTFGDLVAGACHAWGKRKAKGIIRLAIKTHLIEFRGTDRFVIV
jgi:hypothetical protein